MAVIFSFLGEAAAPRSSLSGTSIEDLENHLRSLLGTKVASSKAEHISFTYELSSATKFTVAVSQSENDVLEGLGGIDPALGGARSAANDDPAQLSRIIMANDTIMNQSQNDHSLQKAVAKHIIGAVGACEASSWVLREMSRGNHGWTFTYICKDSMLAWRRQHKDVENAVIADYSAKEADPLTTARPAFDCLGQLVISFSRNTRSITVKYKHTPYHKTVAELYEHFAPPPRPVPLPAATATPKSAKSSRKRASTADGEQGSARKKRRKKKSNAATGEDGNDQSQVDGNDASIVDSQNGDGTPKPKRKRQPRPKKNKTTEAAGQEGGAPPGGQPTANGASTNPTPIVIVDPAEAARRRETAIGLLRGANVDPESLSEDQFNIFSNQSPGLQQESLAMLVQYGAERLRIVHPNKDAPKADVPASGSDVPVTAEEPAGQPQTATPKKRGTGTPKPRVSRGSCTNCRGQKKVKCGLEKPSCQNCIDKGIECPYPLQQSRPRKSKSDAVVADNEDPDEESPMVEAATAEGPQESQDNPPEELNAEPNLTTTFQAFNDAPQQNIAVTHTSEVFMEAQDHVALGDISTQQYPLPDPQSPEPAPYPDPPAAPQANESKRRRGGKRRSLPSSAPAKKPQKAQKAQQEPVPLVFPETTTASDWETSTTNTAALVSTSNTHEAQQSSTTLRHDVYAHPYQDIQQVAALSHAALSDGRNTPVQPTSQTQGSRSPFQATARHNRTKSRQGHRAQTRTPVPAAPSSHSPLPTLHQVPQQPMATARQPTPASGAPYQDRTRTVPATKDPDAATYTAASSLSGLGNYGYTGYATQQTESDQTSSRVSYEPYSNHTSTSNQTYNSYDTYSGSGATTTANMSLSTSTGQSRPAAYAAPVADNQSRWIQSQTGNAVSSSSSTPATTYSHPSPTAQTSSATHFNLLNPSSQSSSHLYTEKSQQQQQQQQQQAQSHYNYASHGQTQRITQQQQQPQRQHQQQQHQRQRQQTQRAPQSHARASQQQQQPQQQQGWYPFNSSGASQSDYRSTRTSNTGYVSGPESYQHHNPLNMASHSATYGGADNDAALMDLLGGSVHHRQ